ncbi:YqaJ viral recombinase family protein [Herbaspirillum huttiense]|uniref:YqaJ viral recombinase family protein n=1 Tax=Herbaspirillum huttiense TaxID=863372 RepID=UPI002E7874E2|nr:YqaJ viral recombinase family protein [Herbaspirillum huttiense]MEE1636390.1 YqaJ viral recombinase family protein [Herbaspirillum huttiense NC40101]
MEVLNVAQGSQEWLDARRAYHTASEAPAAMGHSKYVSRTKLLAKKTSGIEEHIDSHKQALFDRGHEAEALARPFAEKIIGAKLYPVTAVANVDGVPLLASLDGCTMSESTIWEHKLANQALLEDVRAGILDPHYSIQLDQQLLVSRATRCLFTVSDGTEENMEHIWYEPDQEKFALLVAGWKQFIKDMEAFVPPEAEKVLAAEPVLALPAVSVQVSGTISVVNNFPAFEVAVRNFLENDLIREPKTDQDFVNLDLQIKEMKSGREAIKLAKGRIFSQMEAVDAAVRTAEMLDSLLQQNCSMAEKLLASEKERRRAELIETARKAMTAHGEALQSEIQGVRLAVAMPDFAGAIKGLKTLTSMKEKLDAALANGKAAADMAAADICKKLAWVTEHADEHRALLADMQQLVAKPMEDFQLVVQTRIQQHQQRQEQERERIRQEEADRLEREAAIKQQNILAEKAQEAEAAAQAPRTVVAPAAAPAPVAAAPRREPSGQPTLRLGQICERIAPLSITADGLAALGYEPAKTEKASKFYHEEDFPAMCQAIANHVLAAANHQRKEAA